MDKNVVLDVKNLHVHYVTHDATAKAVNGIDFQVKEGEALGLVGETGAGKTTTALSIMQLIPDPPGIIVDGEIYFEGKNVILNTDKENQAMRGNGVAMIFQDPMTALNPVMTVGDQLSEVVLNHEKVSKAEAKQRVVIAMSLLCNPKLLIADEPTTALDVTIQAQVLDIINQLREQYKMAMVLITHDLGVVAETCDNVAIMYAGQIVEAGTVREVYLNPKHPYTRGLFDSIPKLDDDSTELIPIEGAISNAADLPTGCYFHPRCRYCQDICKTQQPTVKGEGHKFMCHFDLFSKEEEK